MGCSSSSINNMILSPSGSLSHNSIELVASQHSMSMSLLRDDYDFLNSEQIDIDTERLDASRRFFINIHRRTIKMQSFLTETIEKGEAWSNPGFPAEESSLSNSQSKNQDKNSSFDRPYDWKRASDCFSSNRVFSQRMTPYDMQ